MHRIEVVGTSDPFEDPGTGRAAVEALPRGTPHRLFIVRGARHGQLLGRYAPRVDRTVTRFLLTYLAR